MIRRIINIDEEKCDGCGLCAVACHEGAICMAEGKARLMRDDYCDGLGDCLPACPAGAITFTEREAAAYDQQAVEENKKAQKREGNSDNSHAARQHSAHPYADGGGCPGSRARQLERNGGEQTSSSVPVAAQSQSSSVQEASQLRQWPVQIKLAPVRAPYYEDAALLIAADCTAYAYGSFHQDFMRGKITLVGCPKLDGVNYADKLTEIIRNNPIKSVTVVRMEVPCCGGIENAVKEALQASGRFIPWQVVTISTEGVILD